MPRARATTRPIASTRASSCSSGGGPAVGGRPPATMVLRWFECAWLQEVQLFSHREQVAYSFLLDALGVRRSIYVLGREEVKDFVRIGRHEWAAGMG